MKIGILCIATKNYKSFVQQLVDGVEKYFLTNHEVVIYLFTDEEREYKSGLKIVQTIIPAYGWPEASMLRFKTYTSIEYDCDYLFHSDIDMGFVDYIGDEVLNEITVVSHPGFYNGLRNGTWEERKSSFCFVPPDRRLDYVAGGFNGGKSVWFYHAMILMRNWIDNDLSIGITPRYHDESAINKLITISEGVTILTPDYCMPEARTKRIAWGINHIEPKILALEKDTKYMRS
jgi:hypothetical protein